MNERKVEIYFFDPMNLPATALKFRIANEQLIVIVFAGLCDKHEIRVDIAGENSLAKLTIMPIVWQSQTFDLDLKIHHSSSKSKSYVQVIGAVADNAHLNINVASTCDKQVCDIVTEQSSSILLLNPQAHARVMPSIQSMHLNAHCKHGSSIKSFDKDQLIYLKSRGIDYKKARDLLCESFLLSWIDSVISKNERESIMTYVQQTISQSLVK